MRLSCFSLLLAMVLAPNTGIGFPSFPSEIQGTQEYNGGVYDIEGLQNQMPDIPVGAIMSHPDAKGSEEALARALKFYSRAKNGGNCGNLSLDKHPVKNDKCIIVTDYTKPQYEKRQYIIYPNEGIQDATWASHGYGSNSPISACPEEYRIQCKNRHGITEHQCEIPVNFENKGGIGTTLTGFFISDESYPSTQVNFRIGEPKWVEGQHNAVRLHGIEPGVNDTAHKQAKVWHRAGYANYNPFGQGKTATYQNQCANSAGCPAIPPEVFEKHKEACKDGAVFYHHTIKEEEKPDPCGDPGLYS